jgi:S1-C subfamily serine protease
MFRKQRDLTAALAAALALSWAWLAVPAQAQSTQPTGKEDATLVVDGVVQQVFSSSRPPRTDYCVQIEVRRSEARKTANTTSRTRFPVPGEVVYVHVSQQPRAGLTANVDSVIPAEHAAIRAYLVPREHGIWEGTLPGWFDALSDFSPQNPASPNVAGGAQPAAAASLGMTFEPVTVKDRLVLRVKSVERGGPAQQVGIEVGDVIIGVNEQPLENAGQLGELARRGEPIPLMVVDVNTNRTARLELRPSRSSSDVAAADPKPAQRRSLGLSAEPVRLGLRTALKVTRVEEGSPAHKAGIEPEDILVAANGAPLTGPEQLGNALRKSGPTLSLTVRDSRTGKDVPVEVAVGGPTVVAKPSEDVPVIAGQAGGLGAVTELAFYDVEAAVKVTEVQPGSPAARAGLQPGLLILEANGKPVIHPNELNDAVRNSSGTLKLVVVDPRSGQKSAVQVNLGR